MRMMVLIVVLAVFSIFSTWVVVTEGYWGFLTLAASDRWGLQVFLDLCIAMCLLMGHMIRRGQNVGLSAWPYIVALPFLGSISALAFYIHVEVVLRRQR